MLLQTWRSTLMFFAISNLLIIGFKSMFVKWGLSVNVLLGGNIFLCTVTLLSITLFTNALKTGKQAQFMNAFYGSTFIKIILSLIVLFIYVYTVGKPDKRSIFCLFGFYLVYSVIEVTILQQLMKKRK